MKTQAWMRCVVGVVTLHLTITGIAQTQVETRPARASLPASSSLKTAAAAGTLLRQLYFQYDYHDGVALGDTLVRRFPRDMRVRAWYVANAGGARLATLADSLTARIDTMSRDPWALAARSIARTYSPAPSKFASAEATHLARRARSLAPSNPDFAWLVANSLFLTGGAYLGNFADVVAYADSVGPRVGNPVELQVVRASAMYSASFGTPTGSSPVPPPADTVKRNAAFSAFAAAAAADPTNVHAKLEAGSRMRTTREDEALALMKAAVSLSPRAPLVRSIYWTLINAQRGPAKDKQAAIASDRSSYLAATDSAPWALATVIQSMRSASGREPEAPMLEQRILARAPRSMWAEEILLSQANQWRDSLYAARDSTRPGPKSDSNVVRKRYIDAVEAFLDKPWVANPATRDQAVLFFFFEVREDSTYPTDKMVTLAKRLIAMTSGSAPSFRYGEAARVLANRKVEFRYAEQLTREGLKGTAHYLNDFPGYRFTSVGDQADALDGANATLYDDLGFLYFNEGRYADADKELTHALELSKKNVTIYYDLGRLRAAQGRDEEAELTYAQGMTIRYRGVNPNRKELERLYEKKHGSVDGWEKYIAALEEKERATRKAKILATRGSDPTVVPPFNLPDLDGRIVHSDSVRSQYLVVNFWGMWCGPCVAEMPELQQFYEKYRNDKSISIVTISNDKDLEELRSWMSKRKLTIPTLFDDGYVARLAQIHAFPTTWFIDRDGKLQFTAVGNTGALVDEWSWRLEAMRAGPAVQP